MKLPKFFKTKWRVVTDNYCGYEIQKKLWWLPFWFQTNKYGKIGGVSTFSTVDEAMKHIQLCSKYKSKGVATCKYKPKVVATYEP